MELRNYLKAPLGVECEAPCRPAGGRKCVASRGRVLRKDIIAKIACAVELRLTAETA
jgi:hypothetical protein